MSRRPSGTPPISPGGSPGTSPARAFWPASTVVPRPTSCTDEFSTDEYKKTSMKYFPATAEHRSAGKSL